jgi:mitogen-activated protein kinase kinase kinase 3
VEDANSSNNDDVDHMPLPDDDDGNVEPGLNEDDVQSSPSRPAVLDHADIDPAPSRISATTPAAAQNVLAELPTDTDLFAAALQKSAAKTPRALPKKNTTAAASPSPKVATPAPGLPFGEVRVGEAPIFSPLSFHGGAMATAASATTSSSANSNGMGRARKARASVGGASRPGRTSIGGAGRRRMSAAPSAAVAAGDGIGILGMLGAAAPICGREPLMEHNDESGSNDCESKGSTGSKEDASAPSTSEQNAREDSAADGAPLPLEVEPKEPANVADKSCDDDEVLASPESESTVNKDVAPEPSVGASLVQSPENLEETMNNDSVEEEDTPSSSTGSSDGDSNGSDDDETESEASSCSSSSDDVSIVLPNRKKKQSGQRRSIQASDEDSDGSFQVDSSSDDAKDEDDDEDDVLVSDDDKGDDGSYTIESDEEDEDDDDVLIYESDESSVGAKPAKKAGASRKKNVKPKARARVIESEDDSDGSIESESQSVASLERSMKAASIAASNSNDESIIQAEVVDDGESAADDDSAPSEETILRAADGLFVAADKESITVRDICNSIEDRFGLTLEKPTKKVIKAHLIALINEEIQPIVGDTAGDDCSDNSRITANEPVSGSLGELEDTPEPKNQSRRRGGLPSSSAAEPMSLETTLASAASNGGSANSRSLGTKKGSVRRGKWSRGAQLGVGSFGVVHMGMNQRNGQMMAVKTMNMPEDDEDGLLSDLEGEVHVMRALNHPNIVRYIGCERDLKRSTLAIFQEWVPGGSISSLLRKFGPFPLPVIRKYLYQICTGLAYLHENGIIHRDIKGSNILVTDEGVCKLADFGASRRLRSSADNSEGSEEQDDMEQSLTMRGTPYFMAPEVFEERYGTKSDIWSFGCVAFQMCSGLPPWKASGVRNPYDLIRLLKESEDVPELPKDIDSKLESLIRACFQRDPSLRPNAETLLQHRFFDVDECSTVFSGESSSFGVKSPSARKAARKSSSSSASHHHGESSYHFPAEYDEKEWPKWAKCEDEKSGESDAKNPFGRSRK